MNRSLLRGTAACVPLALVLLLTPCLHAQGEWEVTPEGQKALARGLQWLARNQGPDGNWGSNDLGLVSTGLLAYIADGHLPNRGRFGSNVQKAMDYVVRNEVVRDGKPTGLLNIAEPRRGMYNHGLSTFVLGQLYGMTNDQRVGHTLDRALKVLVQTQCEDGGWEYVAERQQRGHDLSLAVMQALALRSAVDSGLDVPPETVDLAIKSVREHYTPHGVRHDAPEDELKKHPGRFTYMKGGGQATLAMAAAGVVCLQEFGQYDDWRIEKNIKIILEAIDKECDPERCRREHRAPFDAYTLYYVAQALYQVGGEPWKKGYPRLRDAVAASQIEDANSQERDGSWTPQGHVGGRPGELYATAVGCFVLSIPNRYLPILQEGRIDTLRARFGSKPQQ
jgi:hypothetical protein